MEASSFGRFVALVKQLLLIVLVGFGVAITYFYFEALVRHSTAYIWDDVFQADEHRWVVVPLCWVLTLAYFGIQHRLDPKSEGQQSEGLGSIPTPTVVNYVKVLLLGFLSLLAGASLGPEAILVPACVLLGSYIGVKFTHGNQQQARLLGMAGFIALFTAFFNSFIVGILGLFLIKKQFKLAITSKILVVAVVASGVSAATLSLLESSAYVKTPQHSWGLDPGGIFLLMLLGAAGYGMTFALKTIYTASQQIVQRLALQQWWARGLMAATGLSVLYIFGGPLVWFTGNESIVPMFQQATSLGFLGLLGVLIAKLLAISWSRASGYRGGLIFPTVFAASVLVAIAQLAMHDLNHVYGIIVVLAGMFTADAKAKFLL